MPQWQRMLPRQGADEQESGQENEQEDEQEGGRKRAGELH